jgi:structure-specific recognition protein 1
MHIETNDLKSSALIAAALDNDELLASSGGADQGSADEDEESVDEDFRAESESDGRRIRFRS